MDEGGEKKMTREIIVGIKITCDICGSHTIVPSVDPTGFPDVDVTRAENKGWHCSMKEDICPVCFTEY